MMDEYKVAQLDNVIKVSNLEPPEWYDEEKGGYTYRWTNLTNLKHNESINNEQEIKKVYYDGLGSKGRLGYKDGSYYHSCKDQEFLDARQDIHTEWKYEILNFYSTYDMADYNETYHLWNVDADGSKEYYNGNNGFKKIDKIKSGEKTQGDLVAEFLVDREDAIKHFMNKDPKERTGIYNGFRFASENMNIIDSFTPYQIPGRKESKTVIDSIAKKVALDESSSSIPPIDAFPIDDNVIPGIKAGILNPSGNHSKKGCKASNASNMNVLYIPKERASLLDALGIQQYAIGCNPEDNEPRNPSQDDEHIGHIRDLMVEKGYPRDHSEIENYLKNTAQIEDPTKRRKLKDRAEDKKNHAKNNTTPIAWDTKGWTDQAKRVTESLTKDSTYSCVMSATSHNIEKFVDIKKEYREDKKLLKTIKVLIHGKDSGIWNMWRNEDKGIKRAKMLTKEMNLKNIKKKPIKILYLELPDSHPNVGVDNTNFWTSPAGENWLDSYDIKLEDTK